MVCRFKRTILLWLVFNLNHPVAELGAMAAAIPDEFMPDMPNADGEPNKYEGSGASDATVSDRQVAERTVNEEGIGESDVESRVRPVDVEVAAFTPHEITLKWRLPLQNENAIVNSYRIWYMHGVNFTDVKTITSNETTYKLSGLEPFTMYEIWIEVIIENTQTNPSTKISAHTDVDQPGPPGILNLTCYDTGSLLVEWSKPSEFYNTVDYYKIFHRAVSESTFKSVVVRANTDQTVENFVILNLEGNREYVVKICAETQSLSNSTQTWVGPPSAEMFAFLPAANCQESKEPPNMFDTGELSAGMVGGAVCAVIFLIIAIVGFVVWRHHFKAAYYYLDEPHRPQPPSEGIPNWEAEPGPDGQAGAIPVHKFEEHVIRNHVDSDSGFSKEYGEIQKHCLKGVKATFENSSHPDNKCKNRYLNIVAYDHTRVKLMPVVGQKKTSDYINGNYIDGFRKCNAYIGTQGPLEDTREAFWRMVWEQNVYVIVMITNLVERGRRKCDIYWPKEDSEIYGQIAAQLEKEEIMADYTIRTIKLKHLKLKKKKGPSCERVVKQFHYTSWPDHGVPCHPLPVLTFVRKSAAANPQPTINGGESAAASGDHGNPGGQTVTGGGGPIVVHCSAGVGRTGTYIAIDTMLQQVKATNEFNVYGFLKHIRGQRNHLVQTEEQYVFIHDAIVEAMKSGNTEIEANDLPNYVANIHNEAEPGCQLPMKTSSRDTIEKSIDDEDESDGKSANNGSVGEKEKELSIDIEMDVKQDTILGAQFKLITAFSPSEYQYLSAHKLVNESKNRHKELVPVEAFRIPLAPKPGVDGSDYINASWLNGHNKLKEFIISQHPMSNTKEDFWRMLWDHNAQTVVLLSSIAEEEFPVFWPLKDLDFDCETFRVRFVEETVHEGHSTFDLVVSSQHDDYELAVRIIHCPEWHSLHNLAQAFSVLKVVQDWHLEYQGGPLVVIDKNGGTEAATFCALTTLCKQLDSSKSLDIYQVAKLYHNKRPGIWASSDDILYLYKAMETLVASKRANPLHDGATTSNSVTIVTDVQTTNVTSSNSVSGNNAADRECENGVIERRHSASASSNLTTDWVNGTPALNGGSSSRRHSLPSINGNLDTIHDQCPFTSLPLTIKDGDNSTSGKANGNGCVVAIDMNGDSYTHDEDDYEDEEDISETAALTQKSRKIKESL